MRAQIRPRQNFLTEILHTTGVMAVKDGFLCGFKGRDIFDRLRRAKYFSLFITGDRRIFYLLKTVWSFREIKGSIPSRHYTKIIKVPKNLRFWFIFIFSIYIYFELKHVYKNLRVIIFLINSSRVPSPLWPKVIQKHVSCSFCDTKTSIVLINQDMIKCPTAIDL